MVHLYKKAGTFIVMLVILLVSAKAWAQEVIEPHTCDKPCVGVLDSQAEIEGKHFALITITSYKGCAHERRCELRDAYHQFPIVGLDGERLSMQEWLRSVYAANQGLRPTVLRGCVTTHDKNPPEFADEVEKAFCKTGVVNYFAVPSNGWRATIKIPQKPMLTNEQRVIELAQVACAALSTVEGSNPVDVALKRCDQNYDLIGAGVVISPSQDDTTSSPDTETAEPAKETSESAASKAELESRLRESQSLVDGLRLKEQQASQALERERNHKTFWFVVTGIMLLAAAFLFYLLVRTTKASRKLRDQLQKERSQPTSPPNNQRIRELEEALLKAERQLNRQVEKDRQVIEDERSAAKKKLEELKAENTSVREELARKNRELADSRNLYVATDSDNQKLLAANKYLESENSGLAAENQRLRELMGRESAEKQAVSMRANQLQDELNRRSNTLNGLGAVSADMAHTESGLDDLKQQVKSLLIEKGALESEVKRLLAENGAQDVRLQEAAAEIEIKAERIQELEERVTDLEEGSSVRELREELRKAHEFAKQAHDLAQELDAQAKIADEEFVRHLADRDDQISDLQARNEELEKALKSANDNTPSSPTTESPVSPTTENPAAPVLQATKETVNQIHDQLLSWITVLRRVSDLKNNLAVYERTLARLDPPKGEDDEYALENRAGLERKISATHAELAQAQEELRAKERELAELGADRLTIRELDVEAGEVFTRYTDRLVDLEFLIDGLNERMRVAPSPSKDQPIVEAFHATVPQLVVLLGGNPDIAEDAAPVDVLSQVVDLAEARNREASKLAQELDKQRQLKEKVMQAYRLVVGADFDPDEAEPMSRDFGSGEGRPSLPLVPYVSYAGGSPRIPETIRPDSRRPLPRPESDSDVPKPKAGNDK